MADEKTEVTAPTIAELEGKVTRLTEQVSGDAKSVTGAERAIESAMKSNDLARVLELSSARELAVKSAEKSASQLKTAQGAIVSGKRAANAGAIAEVHNAMRADKHFIAPFDQLAALGVEWTKVEKSAETGKWIFNSGGAEVKRTRGSGNGTGSRGQSLTVDGTEYQSASAACKAFFPNSGPLNRESIISKLTQAGHDVGADAPTNPTGPN